MRRDASVCPHCRRESPAWEYADGRWWARTNEGKRVWLDEQDGRWRSPAEVPLPSAPLHFPLVRTLDDIEALLERFPAHSEGNRAAASYLWGYLYGDRLGRLRGLVRWARDTGLTDQEGLRTWAYASEFERAFAGKVKGLGIAAYCWLVMRLGVDTVKPDVWLHAFVKRVLGRDLDDAQVVRVVTEAAHRVGRSARELDAGIWESERGAPGTNEPHGRPRWDQYVRGGRDPSRAAEWLHAGTVEMTVAANPDASGAVLPVICVIRVRKEASRCNEPRSLGT